MDNPDRRTLNRITEIMNNSITGWERKGMRNFNKLGKQKTYVREMEYIEPYEDETPFT